MTLPTDESERTDGRKAGLSTQGYPLRKIVERVNDIHVLSCGHKLPKPAEATDYDLRKSRRCVECGPKLPLSVQLQILADDPRPDTDRLQVLIYLVKQIAEKTYA